MKIKFIVFYILSGISVYSQSVLTLGPGTSMGVLTGSDLCVNIVNGTGVLYGGGTICGGLVAVEPVAGNEIPREFALIQNYPNPFNPKTNIRIQMPNSGIVKLTVFDMTGKEIAILVNETLNAGTYNIDFDASHLASGTYLYKLVVGENTNNGGINRFSDVKKMILIK